MLRQLTRQWHWCRDTRWWTPADTLAQVQIDARGKTQVSLEAYVMVDTLADKLAQVEVLTLNETLAQKKAHACPHNHLQVSRGGE